MGTFQSKTMLHLSCPRLPRAASIQAASLSVGRALKSTQISFWIRRSPSEWNICSFKNCCRPARCFRIVLPDVSALPAVCLGFYFAVYRWRDTEAPCRKKPKKQLLTGALPGCQPQLPGFSWVNSRRRVCAVQVWPDGGTAVHLYSPLNEKNTTK